MSIDIIIDILKDTVIDAIRLLPFLFLTYLFIEALENRAGGSFKEKFRSAGRLGPIIGGLLGIVPQCGFSAAASGLYAEKFITAGALIAVFLSTSDEMLPILISESFPVESIVKILVAKLLIAIVSGLLIEWIVRGRIVKSERAAGVAETDKKEAGQHEHGILRGAIHHTLEVFTFIFLFSLVLNFLIEGIGEDAIKGLFTGIPVLGEMIAGLIGLIPNCASSVVITEMYLNNLIGAGPMMSGLLVNAGIGMVILFKNNKEKKENFMILGAVYLLGVAWGSIIELVNLVF